MRVRENKNHEKELMNYALSSQPTTLRYSKKPKPLTIDEAPLLTRAERRREEKDIRNMSFPKPSQKPVNKGLRNISKECKD